MATRDIVIVRKERWIDLLRFFGKAGGYLILQFN
jgi:hypothetical protein